MTEELVAQAMKPEDVGPIVVRGIKANRLTILTHPEMVISMTAKRFSGIKADGEAEVKER